MTDLSSMRTSWHGADRRKILRCAPFLRPILGQGQQDDERKYHRDDQDAISVASRRRG